MKNVGDKELVTILVNEHKLSASSMANLILESSDQSLRNDATNILTRTFQHQKQLFDLMSQKGWYATKAATQQDLSTAKQEVSKIQSSISMM